MTPSDTFPHRFLAITAATTQLYRRFVITTKYLTGHLCQLLPSSSHLMHTRFDQSIVRDPLDSCDTSIIKYYAHVLRATRLLLCHLVGSQHHYSCVSSPLHLRCCPLCIGNYATQSLVCHLSTPSHRYADWVYIVEIER